jgi:toxin YoeB
LSWSVRFTRQAQKDARKLAAASPALRARAEQLLELLADDPFRQPPHDQALVGDLRGAFSRRLNIQHRLVVQVLIEERVVKVLRLWTPYG